MHYRLEAWSVPGVGPFVKILGDLPAVSVDVSADEDDYGYGSIEIPASWPYLDRIVKADPVTPANNTYTLIRGYADGAAVDEPDFEFVAQYADHKIGEKGDRLVRIHGDGIAARTNEAILYPWSDLFPDWVWGGRELLTNPNFEDGTTQTVYELWHNHTGGTYTLNVTPPGLPLDTTGAIAWNADAAAVQAEIIATGVTEASVTGSGTEASPFQITVQAPVGHTVIAVATNSLTGGDTLSLENTTAGDTGSLDPWTRSTNPDTGKPHGGYASDGFRLTTDAEAGDVIEGQRSLRINGLSQFAGAQQKVRGIKPGSPLTAGVTAKTGDANNRFRLVLRDLNEELLATTPETVIPATFTPTRVTLADVVLTDTSTGVAWRFAHTRDSNPDPFWIDLASLREGLAPATIGAEFGLMFDATKARGRFTWLERTWTDTHDSAGNLWDEDEFEVAFRRGMKWGHHILGKAREHGYEFAVAPKPGVGQVGAGVVTHQLHLYNPEGRGTDRTADQHPAFTTGQIITGDAPQRAPRFTSILSENPAGDRITATDAGLAAAFGTIEEWFPDEDSLTVAALTRAANHRLGEEADNLLGFRAIVAGDHVLPRIHAGIGDTINWTVAPHTAKHPRRISSIRWRARTADQETHWTVEYTASRVRDPETAKARAIRDLLTAYRTLRSDDPLNTEEAGAGAGIPDVVIAAPDTLNRDVFDIEADDTLGADAAWAQALELCPTVGGQPVGWIHFLQGTFLWRAPADWPQGVKVTGAGQAATVLKAVGTIASIFEMPTYAGNTYAGDNRAQIMADLTLDGNKGGGAVVSAGLITVATAVSRNLHFQRVTFRNSSTWGHGGGSSNNTNVFEDCHVHDNTSGGLKVQSETRHLGGDYYDNGGPGFQDNAHGGYHHFIGTKIHDNGSDGIQVADLLARAGLLVGLCTITNNGGWGIDQTSLTSPSIVALNVITGNAAGTVRILKAGSIVTDNILDGTPTPNSGGNAINGTIAPAVVAQTITFSRLSDLATLTGTQRWVPFRAGRIVGVRAAVGTAPTGAGIRVNVRKNGSATGVFALTADQPTIADGANIGTVKAPTASSTFVGGDYYTVDIDQVGSTTPGADLTVHIEFVITEGGA